MKEILDRFLETFELDEVDLKTYSPLSLAYIGDAAQSFLIKFYIVKQGNKRVNDYHKLSKDFISAKAQAKVVDAIMDELTEEEVTILKRGRNAKSQTLPKHATRAEYSKSTAFECLLGYLLLKKEYDRLIEIIVKGIEYAKKDTDIN